MNKLKIIWTREIPKEIGYYLCRSFRDGFIKATRITKKDLEIQKEDTSWLGGVHYSQPFIEGYNEQS